MQILVAGATGFLGKPLCGELLRTGHSITAVSRDPQRAARLLPKEIKGLDWAADELRAGIGAADAIVNLAGEPIANKRWTEDVKSRLRSSRVDTTRRIVDAMRSSGRPGQVLINASAVGYYGDAGDRDVTEETPPGRGFLAELCVDWEAEARRAEEFGARVALLRIGIVLAQEGGMMDRMLPIFRLGIGGPIGNGKQWLPWIHRADVVRLFVLAVERADAVGPIDVTSPSPVRFGAFARSLGRALHRPAVLPAPAFALRLLLGEFAESVLAGQKALPRVATKLGFNWTYPTLDAALRNIVGKDEENG